jgi:hypothetical protein
MPTTWHGMGRPTPPAPPLRQAPAAYLHGRTPGPAWFASSPKRSPYRLQAPALCQTFHQQRLRRVPRSKRGCASHQICSCKMGAQTHTLEDARIACVLRVRILLDHPPSAPGSSDCMVPRGRDFSLQQVQHQLSDEQGRCLAASHRRLDLGTNPWRRFGARAAEAVTHPPRFRVALTSMSISNFKKKLKKDADTQDAPQHTSAPTFQVEH